MKHTLEEIEKMLDSDFVNEIKELRKGSQTYLEEFEIIDSSKVEKESDESLIEWCRSSSIQSGWGQLAELLKRFKIKIEENKRLREALGKIGCCCYPESCSYDECNKDISRKALEGK